MSTGKIILLVCGVIALLASFSLIAGGSTLIWADIKHVDNEGFLASDTLRIERDSNAVVIGPIELDEVAVNVLKTMGMVTTFKFESENNDASKQIFMGVADQTDLDSYLDNVPYDELTGYVFRWNLDFDEVRYTSYSGTALPSNPTSESMWTVSTVGTGSEVLEWQTEAGNNSVVIMNGDGSEGIDVDLIVKAKVPSPLGWGLGLLTGGIVFLVIGGLMVFQSVRQVRS
jgi:hypothetical protein